MALAPSHLMFSFSLKRNKDSVLVQKLPPLSVSFFAGFTVELSFSMLADRHPHPTPHPRTLLFYKEDHQLRN